jgi:hypothetical protein
MWFNPTELKNENNEIDSVAILAILAIPAIYPPDISTPTPETGRNSRNSENSNEAANENEKADLLKIAEIARIATHPEKKKPISCGKCLHFKSHHSHGKGAGRCLAGGAYGSWSETQHHCSKFDAAIETVYVSGSKPNALMITIYFPNGNTMEVEADNPEHAKFLQRMNPKPRT